MSFGLCTAGASFQRAMDEMLEGIECSTAYIDDILTASCGFNNHLRDVQRVFERLKKARLKMKPAKCKFGFKATKFLGFIVSAEGLKVDESRCEAIKNYPRPKTPRQVRKFLGFASFYRLFVKGFADRATPLTRLTHKTQKFIWTQQCEDAFNDLRQALLGHQFWYFQILADGLK